MTAASKTPAKANPKATKEPRTKRAQAEEPNQRAACQCGCGGFPSKPRSRFLPGHDARHYAALKRAARDEAGRADEPTAGKAVA
jgi:hypothetical protein